MGCEGERPVWSHLKSYVEGAAAKERGCHLHCHHFGPSHDHSSLDHCNNLLLTFLLLMPSLRLISSQSLGLGQGTSIFGSSPGSCVQSKLKSTALYHLAAGHRSFPLSRAWPCLSALVLTVPSAATVFLETFPWLVASGLHPDDPLVEALATI